MVLEIVGYIGSAMVVISMLMSSIIKLRVINTIGSIISGVYAVLCGALPLALMNACLITINLISLYKLSRKRPEIFQMVRSDSDNILLKNFMESYGEDIRRYFPDYQPDAEKVHDAYIVVKEGAPVGVLMGDVEGSTLDILVDYSTPTYRDCSVGLFLHSQLPQEGIKSLRFAKTVAEGHESYLKKMGYTPEGQEWVLQL